MSNLMYLARSGLSSAQSALNVVGNNMNNAFTEGYSRQSIVLGQAGGKSTNYGFFGYGVQVDDVQRAYDGFINNQLRGATTNFMSLYSRNTQLTQIDNMLGDDSSNVSASLNNIFTAMEGISKDPVGAAERQETLSNMQSISYQYQSYSNTLNGLEKSTNTLIEQSVKDINTATEQLANINKEISKIQAQTGGVPADLLDQRDLLLNQLSQQVDIRVEENTTTGIVSVSMANGLPLVNGDRSYKLETSASPENPAQTIVSYVDASGNSIRLDESKITNGNLGGLFKFRNEDLVQARNDLNMMALQMANRFNEVNRDGYDLNGNRGEDLFSFKDPVAQANRNNAGDASFDISWTNISEVQAQEYTLTFKGPGQDDWEVVRADGSKVTPTIGDNGELEFDGISMMPNGTPQPGDSFRMNPVENAAGSLKVAITSGDQIAASSSDDPTNESNNENIKALIAIRDERLIGNATLTEAYASLVSNVGSSMSSLKSNLQTSAKVVTAVQTQQQSVAGVDIYEEYVNLQMFQQYYQANAQVLQTAVSIFDTILSIR
ncbi:flagellar hook-associated protein FlgK [Jejubacter calystegiae]|uniref:Flagellar hook-associated protein 1 n=1 Tax=Jejubacter calystegiae TaxID=2579935 RepID=A0A4P8YGW6_9ENTR|nr:flagellar hook-associated protein FlgK [Jejubacter calystegiae]QCT19056.1 flagellar hook-associated protein FlgK [Jejubacter calystegiae]